MYIYDVKIFFRRLTDLKFCEFFSIELDKAENFLNRASTGKVIAHSWYKGPVKSVGLILLLVSSVTLANGSSHLSDPVGIFSVLEHLAPQLVVDVDQQFSEMVSPGPGRLWDQNQMDSGTSGTLWGVEEGESAPEAGFLLGGPSTLL